MVDLHKDINFKDLDFGQIMKSLSQLQSIVLHGALIVGSLLLGFIMFKDYQGKEQRLQRQIAQAQEKMVYIASQQETARHLNIFKTSFPKPLGEDKIITQITSYASARGISIRSLSPSTTQDMGLYDVSKFTLSALAPDYKSMMYFLRDLEKSPYLFILDSWKGQGEGEINFDTDISMLRIHL